MLFVAFMLLHQQAVGSEAYSSIINADSMRAFDSARKQLEELEVYKLACQWERESKTIPAHCFLMADSHGWNEVNIRKLNRLCKSGAQRQISVTVLKEKRKALRLSSDCREAINSQLEILQYQNEEL